MQSTLHMEADIESQKDLGWEGTSQPSSSSAPVLDLPPSGGAPGAQYSGSASPGILLLCSENSHSEHQDDKEEVWDISTSPTSCVWQEQQSFH